MNLIHYNQADLLDILPILPIPGDTVPFLRSGNDDIGPTDGSGVRSCVTSQLDEGVVSRSHETPCPVIYTFSYEGFHGGDIHDLGVGSRFEKAPDIRKLGKQTYHIASSAATVLPLPVGAPRRTFWFVWYMTWNTCVCRGLKYWNLEL